ncbi:uncharacterized protein LOC128034017 [Gossypium raimondii]|uniref:uncharacterized protein LOC128034017 n=1 Tax=Gossypium raimondii TaxID=29730 RepID=UPI00227C07FF|nr:uncharacterized protein LOC128034017 [Gossypium raimondii]
MSSSSFSPAAPPVFNGDGFHIWLVKMKTYLQAFDLWEVVNTDAEPAPLRANPTVAQIRQHADERTKRHKAMSASECIDVIFTNYGCETPKQAGISLRRSFKIRLLGEHFDEARIVEKVLSTLPERYEAKISSLEDSRDLATISLTELINTFYAQEQRRASRAEDHQEGAFNAKAREASSFKAPRGKRPWKNRPKTDTARSNDQPCRHCKRPGHPEDRCWFRPDAVCQHCKKKGHVERVCKNRSKPRQNQFQKSKVEARVAEDSSDQEECVFLVSRLVVRRNAQKFGSLTRGCTNHMSPRCLLV